MKKILIYTALILSVAYLTYLGCSVTGAGGSWTQSGNDIYYTGGNVGIGTTSPQRPLVVAISDTGAAAIHSQNSDSGFTQNDGLQFTIWQNNGYLWNFEAGDILIGANDDEKMRITSSGNVGIGTTTPQGTLDVNGSIYQRGVVQHADYVFEPDYKLESITEHADFMWKNKHLKAIPKQSIDENGVEIIEIGAHRKGIVEELEKAHIYIAQLEERISRLEELLNER